MPDRNGKWPTSSSASARLEPYLDRRTNPYFGAIVGRYANRIAKGKFTLDGKEYTLAVNNGAQHLHGGMKGFDKQVWKAERCRTTADGPAVQLTYVSPDGEEGYPGTLDADVTYTLTERQRAEDRLPGHHRQAHVVNLTNHTYFNLAGAGSGGSSSTTCCSSTPTATRRSTTR